MKENINFLLFQNPEFRVLICDRQMDRQTDRQTDGQTDG